MVLGAIASLVLESPLSDTLLMCSVGVYGLSKVGKYIANKDLTIRTKKGDVWCQKHNRALKDCGCTKLGLQGNTNLEAETP